MNSSEFDEILGSTRLKITRKYNSNRQESLRILLLLLNDIYTQPEAKFAEDNDFQEGHRILDKFGHIVVHREEDGENWPWPNTSDIPNSTTNMKSKSNRKLDLSFLGIKCMIEIIKTCPPTMSIEVFNQDMVVNLNLLGSAFLDLIFSGLDSLEKAVLVYLSDWLLYIAAFVELPIIKLFVKILLKKLQRYVPTNMMNAILVYKSILVILKYLDGKDSFQLSFLKHVIGHSLQLALWSQDLMDICQEILQSTGETLDEFGHKPKEQLLNNDINSNQTLKNVADLCNWFASFLMLLKSRSSQSKPIRSSTSDDLNGNLVSILNHNNGILLLESYLFPFISNATAIEPYHASCYSVLETLINTYKSSNKDLYDSLTSYLVQTACKRSCKSSPISGPRSISVRKFCVFVLATFYTKNDHIHNVLLSLLDDESQELVLFNAEMLSYVSLNFHCRQSLIWHHFDSDCRQSNEIWYLLDPFELFYRSFKEYLKSSEDNGNESNSFGYWSFYLTKHLFQDCKLYKQTPNLYQNIGVFLRSLLQLLSESNHNAYMAVCLVVWGLLAGSKLTLPPFFDSTNRIGEPPVIPPIDFNLFELCLPVLQCIRKCDFLMVRLKLFEMCASFAMLNEEEELNIIVDYYVLRKLYLVVNGKFSGIPEKEFRGTDELDKDLKIKTLADKILEFGDKHHSICFFSSISCNNLQGHINSRSRAIDKKKLYRSVKSDDSLPIPSVTRYSSSVRMQSLMDLNDLSPEHKPIETTHQKRNPMEELNIDAIEYLNRKDYRDLKYQHESPILTKEYVPTITHDKDEKKMDNNQRFSKGSIADSMLTREREYILPVRNSISITEGYDQPASALKSAKSEIYDPPTPTIKKTPIAKSLSNKGDNHPLEQIIKEVLNSTILPDAPPQKQIKSELPGVSSVFQQNDGSLQQFHDPNLSIQSQYAPELPNLVIPNDLMFAEDKSLVKDQKILISDLNHDSADDQNRGNQVVRDIVDGFPKVESFNSAVNLDRDDTEFKPEVSVDSERLVPFLNATKPLSDGGTVSVTAENIEHETDLKGIELINNTSFNATQTLPLANDKEEKQFFESPGNKSIYSEVFTGPFPSDGANKPITVLEPLIRLKESVSTLNRFGVTESVASIESETRNNGAESRVYIDQTSKFESQRPEIIVPVSSQNTQIAKVEDQPTETFQTARDEDFPISEDSESVTSISNQSNYNSLIIQIPPVPLPFIKKQQIQCIQALLKHLVFTPTEYAVFNYHDLYQSGLLSGKLKSAKIGNEERIASIKHPLHGMLKELFELDAGLFVYLIKDWEPPSLKRIIPPSASKLPQKNQLDDDEADLSLELYNWLIGLDSLHRHLIPYSKCLFKLQVQLKTQLTIQQSLVVLQDFNSLNKLVNKDAEIKKEIEKAEFHRADGVERSKLWGSVLSVGDGLWDWAKALLN